uniref:Uncharacterized protein n=1 Tax=Candidatus Kentrum sp. LPFa TaxID=2126335 RepID=A0A450WXE3_9GAMM|nr:MAG: hypothetical protein BECKLPF1236B_GA0070989_12715 [Candidatus Kentron sp. LPFa]
MDDAPIYFIGPALGLQKPFRLHLIRFGARIEAIEQLLRKFRARWLRQVERLTFDLLQIHNGGYLHVEHFYGEIMLRLVYVKIDAIAHRIFDPIHHNLTVLFPWASMRESAVLSNSKISPDLVCTSHHCGPLPYCPWETIFEYPSISVR